MPHFHEKTEKKLLLIGVGKMGIEYAKVLKEIKADFVAIGRGETSATNFEKEIGTRVVRGGLQNFDIKNSNITHAIVAVSVEELSKKTISLIEAGVKNILVEKPAGLNREEIAKIEERARQNGARILVAYNRRLYSSTQKAKEIIEKDGGVLSFNFEFTEWPSTIEPLPFSKETKENWVLANSSHVIDLAFFLGGRPKEIETHVGGVGGLSWHPSGAIYSGSGISEKGALFSYNANWLSAGRWGVEILTKNRKLILRPLEKLFEQKKGEFEIKEIILNDSLDTKFKPGICLEVKELLGDKKGFLPTIEEHLENLKWILKIAKYDKY